MASDFSCQDNRLDSAPLKGKPQLTPSSREDIGKCRERAQYLNEQGEKRLAQAHITEALPLLEEAWALAPEKDDDLVTEIRRNLMVVYGRSAQFGKAIQLAKDEMADAQVKEDRNRVFFSLKIMGNCYAYIGENREALAHYRKAWQISHLLKDREKEAAVLNNLGAIYTTLKEYEEAIQCHTQALEIRKKEKDSYGVLMSKTNLMSCYMKMGLYEEAEKGYRELIETDDTLHRGLNLCFLGELYYLKGDYGSANRYMKEGMVELEKTGEPDTILRMRLQWAKILLEQDYTRQEIGSMLESIVSRSNGVNTPSFRADALASLADYYYKNARFEEAFDCMAEARELERNIYTEDNKTRVSSLKTLYETELAKREAHTERQKSEALDKALREAEKHRLKAESASAFKSEILHMAAHDLRNPLGAIYSLLQLTEEVPEADQSKDWIRTAKQQAADTLDILDRLLDSAAIENGHITLQKENLSFQSLVQHVILSQKPIAERKKQVVHCRMPENEILVCLDPLRAGQIFKNLLNNAIKYSPEGSSITVEADLRDNCVECAVIDEGPGIEPEEIPQLFQRFSRLKTSRTTGGESSTGLGLYICRLLTEMHGGNIRAESKGLGHGSRFIFQFPTVS